MSRKKKIIAVALIVCLALVSIFGFSRILTSPKTYSGTLEALQNKEKTVALVTAGAAGAATALAAIPDDVTTPVANYILQISSYLVLVTCVIFLEKSLITVFGFLVAYILIPIACILGIVYIFINKRFLLNIAIKFVSLALVLTLIIPMSVKIGDMICDANHTAIEEVISDDENETEEEAQGRWASFVSSIKNGTKNIADKCEAMIMKFLNAITLFIVSTCLIPIGVAFFLVWFIKTLFGLVPKGGTPSSGEKSREPEKKLIAADAGIEDDVDMTVVKR